MVTRRGKQAFRKADARKYEFLEVPLSVSGVYYSIAKSKLTQRRAADRINPQTVLIIR
jgi:hypothetical protein